MSERKEFFEEQLRKRILEHEFEFQENDWQGMETLLDSPPSSPVPPPTNRLPLNEPIFFFYSMLLLCSILGVYFFNGNRVENSANNKNTLPPKTEQRVEKQQLETSDILKEIPLKKEQPTTLNNNRLVSEKHLFDKETTFLKKELALKNKKVKSSNSSSFFEKNNFTTPVFSKKEMPSTTEKNTETMVFNKHSVVENDFYAANESKKPIKEPTNNNIQEAHNKNSDNENAIENSSKKTNTIVELLENAKILTPNLSPKEKNDTFYLLPNKAVCCNNATTNKKRISIIIGSEVTGFKPSSLGVEYSQMLTKILGIGTSLHAQ